MHVLNPNKLGEKKDIGLAASILNRSNWLPTPKQEGKKPCIKVTIHRPDGTKQRVRWADIRQGIGDLYHWYIDGQYICPVRMVSKHNYEV